MLGVEPVVDALTDHLARTDPGGLLGVHLFGSSAVGGLRPDSDVDVLVLTQRSLSQSERQTLLEFLLQHSGRRATVAAGRPLELTSLVVDDVVPWSYPPVCDFLYGEWLRDDFLGGEVPARHDNPDLAVLVTTALQHAVCLHGPPLDELVGPVPTEDLLRSFQDSLDPLLDDLVGDERNVMLTLARKVVTAETGRIVSKDQAADLILPSLREPHRSVLSLAARGYLGEVDDDWTDRQEQVRDTAAVLAARVRSHAR
jgi:streptomycin 3"-adenylyltransferase